MSTGITSEGEIFATSRNPEACCDFLVGSEWFLLFPGAYVQTDSTHLHLNSQRSCLTRRENFAVGGNFRHFSQRRKFPLPPPTPPPPR